MQIASKHIGHGFRPPTASCVFVLQIVPGFRVRTIPVLGTSPALFGMASASYVICSLAGRPFLGEPVFQMQMAQYDTQLARLEDREEARGGTQSELQVDVNDVSGTNASLAHHLDVQKAHPQSLFRYH